MRNKLLLVAFIATGNASFLFAQKTDSTKSTIHLSGAAGATSNGISLIPTFSLGKPAAIFDMSIGKNKLSFDPEVTFSLEGKPWYILFWFRYKLINSGKFRMHAGTHLGINFKNAIQVNVDSNEVKIAERYLATELSPNYFITKNISVGIYYLYSHGLDPTTVKNTNFITANAGFSNIKLTRQFFMNIVPQVYYLNQGEHAGFYFTSSFTLAKNNFPLTISSVINKVIQTNISASKDFVWNLTLTYSFSKKYVAIKE